MRFNAQVIPRGTYVAAADAGAFLPALGYQDDDPNGDSWRLVKAKTAITSPANKVLVFTVTAGTISWACALSDTLSSANVAGVGDPGVTATLAAGDVFWVQRRGVAEIYPLTTVTAVGNLVGTKTTTAGSVGKLVINAATSAVVDQSNAIGKALEAMVTVATPISIRLMNIH